MIYVLLPPSPARDDIVTYEICGWSILERGTRLFIGISHLAILELDSSTTPLCKEQIGTFLGHHDEYWRSRPTILLFVSQTWR